MVIGNGYVSPLDTAFGYWVTLCTTNPGIKEPVFNETCCEIIATKLPQCFEVANICYNHPDPTTYQATSQVCNHGVINYYDGESYAGGRNRFDSNVPQLFKFSHERLTFVFSESQLNVPSNYRSV